MLASSDIIAFVPTQDSAKARAFYEGVLGLRFISDDGFALVFNANGIMIRVVKVQQLTPVQYTILGWKVDGIEKVAVRLQEQGVHFERYGFFQQTISESGLLPAATRWPGSKTPTATRSQSQSIKIGKLRLGTVSGRPMHSALSLPTTGVPHFSPLLREVGILQ